VALSYRRINFIFLTRVVLYSSTCEFILRWFTFSLALLFSCISILHSTSNHSFLAIWTSFLDVFAFFAYYFLYSFQAVLCCFIYICQIILSFYFKAQRKSALILLAFNSATSYLSILQMILYWVLHTLVLVLCNQLMLRDNTDFFVGYHGGVPTINECNVCLVYCNIFGNL
jgi:hypothetical protein